MKEKLLKGISRLDLDKRYTHGWLCRIIYDGKIYKTKFFQDKKYGGREEALRLARRWISFERLEMFKLLSKGKTRKIKKVANSNTNIVGISRITKISKGRRYEYYEASWCPKPGVVEKKAFSINKHGEKEAWYLAYTTRMAAEKKIRG